MFGECAAFCARYDQNSFDPAYDTLPLAHFEPMVRKVFAVPRRSLYVNLETGRMGT
jgi:predicted HD phosphohydrolase